MTGHRIVLLIAVGYVLYAVLLFALQRHVLFPRHAVGATAAVKPADARVFWIASPSEDPVEAWFLPPLNAAAPPYPLVIFAHGNAEWIDDFPEELGFFRRMGMGLLLVEYPGYGRSPGRPSQERIRRAFTEAFDQVCRWPEIDSSRIIFFGRSLGGGVMCDLACVRPPAALILMSTFTSVRDLTTRYLVPGFLVRDPFDNVAALRAYQGPVMILHGRFDEMIPFHHAQTLQRAAGNAQLVGYPCGHNDFAPGWYDFEADVAAFLRRTGRFAGLEFP